MKDDEDDEDDEDDDVPFHTFVSFPPKKRKKHHAGRRISTSSGNITKKMPLCHS